MLSILYDNFLYSITYFADDFGQVRKERMEFEADRMFQVPIVVEAVIRLVAKQSTVERSAPDYSVAEFVDSAHVV